METSVHKSLEQLIGFLGETHRITHAQLLNLETWDASGISRSSPEGLRTTDQAITDTIERNVQLAQDWCQEWAHSGLELLRRRTDGGMATVVGIGYCVVKPFHMGLSGYTLHVQGDTQASWPFIGSGLTIRQVD